MDSPFWTPVWGLLGDADRERMLEATSGVEPSRTVLQVLLWLYMFLTTVVLVNLLIAQMSQTYERGMEQGKEDWCFRRAALIIEFKDTLRGTLDDIWMRDLFVFQLSDTAVVHFTYDPKYLDESLVRLIEPSSRTVVAQLFPAGSVQQLDLVLDGGGIAWEPTTRRAVLTRPSRPPRSRGAGCLA